MQIEVFVLSGERGRGGRFRFFQGSLCFRAFFLEVRDQGRVWGTVENFRNNLFVFGRGSPSSLCK